MGAESIYPCSGQRPWTAQEARFMLWPPKTELPHEMCTVSRLSWLPCASTTWDTRSCDICHIIHTLWRLLGCERAPKKIWIGAPSWAIRLLAWTWKLFREWASVLQYAYFSSRSCAVSRCLLSKHEKDHTYRSSSAEFTEEDGCDFIRLSIRAHSPWLIQYVVQSLSGDIEKNMKGALANRNH